MPQRNLEVDMNLSSGSAALRANDNQAKLFKGADTEVSDRKTEILDEVDEEEEVK